MIATVDPGLTPSASQRGGEAPYALAERRVGVAQPIGVDDLLRGRGGEAAVEDVPDRKGRVVGRPRAGDVNGLHETLLVEWGARAGWPGVRRGR